MEARGVDRLHVRCLRRQRSARQHEKGFSVARRLDTQASNERRDEKRSEKKQDEEPVGLEFEGKIHRKSVSLRRHEPDEEHERGDRAWPAEQGGACRSSRTIMRPGGNRSGDFVERHGDRS